MLYSYTDISCEDNGEIPKISPAPNQWRQQLISSMTAESAQIDPPTITNKRCFIPFSAQAAIPSDFIHGTFKGEPSITIPKATVASLAARFENTLIGKFSQGKPPMDMIRKFLSVQNFTGAVLGNLLDKKHVVFRFEQFDDYVRFFSKPIWNVYGKSMRILKWTPDFDVDTEPSIVPIWICLPRLPIHLVNPDFIFSLVSSFSKPLKVDSATEHLRRPSVARVQVEFDLLEMIPSRIWIQNEAGRGFWQPVLVEDQLPPYCKFCWHIGHEEHFCTVKYPEIRRSFAHTHDSYQHKEFRPKKQAEGVLAKEDIMLDKEDVTFVEPEKLDTGKNPMIGSPIKEDEVMKAVPAINSLNLVLEECNSDVLCLKIDTTQQQKSQAEMVERGLEKQPIEDATSAARLVQGLGTTKIEVAHSTQHELAPENELSCGLPAGSSHENHMATEMLADVVKTGAREELETESKGLNSFANDTKKLDVAAGEAMPRASNSSNQVGIVIDNYVADLDHNSLENQVIKYSEVCPISNPFELLSMHSTKEKSSGIDSRASIQAELKYMCLDPKVQLGEYISDKVFEEKFTPAKKSTRIRKKTQIFDL